VKVQKLRLAVSKHSVAIAVQPRRLGRAASYPVTCVKFGLKLLVLMWN